MSERYTYQIGVHKDGVRISLSSAYSSRSATRAAYRRALVLDGCDVTILRTKIIREVSVDAITVDDLYPGPA